MEAMSKSPNKSVGSSSQDDITDDQALDPYQLSEEAKTEIESSKDIDSHSVASKGQTDYNLTKPDQPSTSESTTTPDKIVIQFSGEEVPVIVSMDTDEQSPNTSVCHLVNRIMDKEAEVLFSRDETNISSEVEESFDKGDMEPSNVNVELDREIEDNNVSDRSEDTLPNPSPVYYRTLREAIKDSDAEPDDNGEEDRDSIEMVHCKDAP